VMFLAGLLLCAVAFEAKPGWHLIKLHEDVPAFWVSEETWETLPDQFATSPGCRFQDLTNHPIPKQAPQPVKNFAYPEDVYREALVEQLLATGSPARPRADLEHLSSYNNRYYTAATGEESAEWIRDTVSDLISAAGRRDASVRLFAHSWRQPSVIARIECTNCTSNEIVILGAHEDSTAPGMPNGRAPGADDDGSGSVTILEVFRILISNNFQPNRPLEFQWYAAEEVGLWGSDDMASSYADDGVEVYSMLQLDMNSYNPNGNALLRVYFDRAYMNEDLTDYVKILCSAYGEIGQNTGSYGYAASDHASWHRAGYPAAHFKESTSYPYIHTANDVTGHLDYDYVWQFVRVATGYAVELSNGNVGQVMNRYH